MIEHANQIDDLLVAQAVPSLEKRESRGRLSLDASNLAEGSIRNVGRQELTLDKSWSALTRSCLQLKTTFFELNVRYFFGSSTNGASRTSVGRLFRMFSTC